MLHKCGGVLSVRVHVSLCTPHLGVLILAHESVLLLGGVDDHNNCLHWIILSSLLAFIHLRFFLISLCCLMIGFCHETLNNNETVLFYFLLCTSCECGDVSVMVSGLDVVF